MSYHDRFHDSIKKIHLELTPICYPPPEIIIHQNEVPKIDSLLVKYDFNIERQVLENSDKEIKKIKEKREAMLIKKLAIKSVHKNIEAVSLNNPITTESLMNDVDSKLFHQPQTNITINNYSNIPTIHQTNKEELLIKKDKPLIDFSEFELPKTVFDMVALKSIDDKAELEQLLSSSGNISEIKSESNSNEDNCVDNINNKMKKKDMTSKNTINQELPNLFQYPSMPSFAFNDFKTGHK
uniref:PPP1R35_C domain-containing protein n=1 Tax=Parastrongyloides trichosuri TaxID=131310 RepID=A0A0N5A1N4_PARTI